MSYTSCDLVLTSYTPLKTMIGVGTTDIATQDIASYYIAGAEGFINAFIGKAWVVPVVMPEPLITRLCNDVAVYDILKDHQPRIPDFIQGRYDRAVSILEALRDGKMILTGSNVVATSGGDQYAWSNVLSNPQGPIFTPAEARTHDICSGSWDINRF